MRFYRDVPNGQEPTEAVLGDYNLVSKESSEERLRIQKIFVHPEWSFVPVPNNDIAVLKLEGNLRKIQVYVL